MGGKKIMNRHAAAAAERKEVTGAAKAKAKQDAADNAYWADDGDKKNKKKQDKAAQDAAKQLEKQMRKEEAKAFEREENAQMQAKMAPKKMTQYEIQQNTQTAKKNALEGDKRVVSEKAQNDLLMRENKNECQDVDATGVEGVMKRLEQVDIGAAEEEDMNPERRMKAAHAAFDRKMMPILKADNPGLKRSQLKEMCWKLWNKSPENPLVQAAAAQVKKK